MNWLAKLSEQAPTAEQGLQEAVSSLSDNDLNNLAQDVNGYEPVELNRMEQLTVNADMMGRELAHAHGPLLEKQALLGALGALGNVLSIGGETAKNMKGFGQPAKAVQGAFKYAMLPMAGAVGKAVGGFGKIMQHSPTKALGLAGAGVGAASGLIDPGRDAQGNQNSRLGAMVSRGAVGGALGAGAAQIGAVKRQTQLSGVGLQRSARMAAKPATYTVPAGDPVSAWPAGTNGAAATSPSPQNSINTQVMRKTASIKLKIAMLKLAARRLCNSK